MLFLSKTQTLFITFKISYFCCFSYRGNLEFNFRKICLKFGSNPDSVAEPRRGGHRGQSVSENRNPGDDDQIRIRRIRTFPPTTEIGRFCLNRFWRVNLFWLSGYFSFANCFCKKGPTPAAVFVYFRSFQTQSLQKNL